VKYSRVLALAGLELSLGSQTLSKDAIGGLFVVVVES
jgi:hypothetical protein